VLIRSFAALLLAITITGWSALANDLTESRTQLTPATSLDAYVHAPDDTFGWELLKTVRDDSGAVVFVLDMKSQSWRSSDEVDRTVWQHWLTIVRPEIVKHPTGFLYITGGDNGGEPPETAPDRFIAMANDTESVVAVLNMVPNQPITFAGEAEGREEDELIAYTWDKFLHGGEDEWLARYPMTKSAVRAMDAVTEFMYGPKGGGIRVNEFVAAGGSKRGWTTWTTAAVDDRVVAIVPIVIDLLNVVPSFVHHWRAYGFWAPAVGDYQAMGIMDWMGHPRYDDLMGLVEPYSYRERMTLPKLTLNATGDQFFLPDSSQFYWDDLPSPKYQRYVPNTDHGLGDSDANETMTAFYYAVLNGIALPKYSWNVKGDRIVVKSPDKPVAVTLWRATNPEARDFRKDVIGEAYEATELESSRNGRWAADIPGPESGWTASFVELTFDIGAPYPFKVSTEVVVRPDEYPFEYEFPEHDSD
jgi:PhoPQ-activated pathogenicity-related protein